EANRPAAHRAVLDVLLALAAARVHVALDRLAAVRTDHGAAAVRACPSEPGLRSNVSPRVCHQARASASVQLPVSCNSESAPSSAFAEAKRWFAFLARQRRINASSEAGTGASSLGGRGSVYRW